MRTDFIFMGLTSVFILMATVMPLHLCVTASDPFSVSFLFDLLSVLFLTKWNYLVFLFMFRYLMNLSLVFGFVTDTNPIIILILSEYPSLGDKYQILWQLRWGEDWFSLFSLCNSWICNSGFQFLNLRLLWFMSWTFS